VFNYVDYDADLTFLGMMDTSPTEHLNTSPIGQFAYSLDISPTGTNLRRDFHNSETFKHASTKSRTVIVLYYYYYACYCICYLCVVEGIKK